MAIKCGPDYPTLTTTNQSVCSHNLRIYDIRSGYPDVVYVIMDDSLIINTSKSGTRMSIDSESFTVYLISKNEVSQTASIKFTIADNLCYGVTCPDTCVGVDLYTQRCSLNLDSNMIPISYDCVPNTIKTPNSSLCSHLTCSGGVCTRVTGTGTDTCTIEGSTTECISNICDGVTCPDTCIGTDLWSQVCSPTGPTTYECLPDTIKEAYNIDCDEYTLYYEVPWIYPTWYINSILPYVQSLGDNTLSSYPDYYLASRTYNETTKMLEIVIKRKPLQLSQIKTLVGPFVILAVSVVAVELAIGIAIFLYGTQYKYAVKGKGVASKNRSVIITPQVCTPTCTVMSVPVNIEYTIDGTIYKPIIPVGTPNLTLTIPNNIDITFKATADGYICKNKIIVCEAGLGQCELNLEFAAVENAKGTILPVDDTGKTITCGTYQFWIAETNTKLVGGALTTDGKTAEVTLPADVLIACTVVPCDDVNYIANTIHFKLSAGTTMSVDNIIESCAKAKNGVSVMTQYISQDGALIGFTPDSITISTTGYTKTYNKGIDFKNSIYIYYINGLEKGKPYTISVIAESYPITNNNQTKTFTTDCFTTEQILMKASAPINTKDFIITVVDSDTTGAVVNATIFLDTDPIGVPTNSLGNTATYTGIPYGKHTVKITKAGYNDTTKEIDVSSTSLGQYIIQIRTTALAGTIQTGIFNLVNKNNLNSKALVQFEGYLKYLHTDTNYYPIVAADVTINIINGTTLVKAFNITTDDLPSIFPGRFTTPEWEIPSTLAKKNIEVIAIYNGSGDLQGTTYSQSFYVDEGCCLSLPFIGCIASQTTCNALKTGAYIAGGLLIGYIGFKAYKSLKSK